MKICHITSSHSPDDIRIYHKQCKSLKKYINNVTILSLKPPVVEDNSINFISIGTSGNRLSRIKDTISKLYKKALEIDADIYQAHDPDLLYVLLKLKKKGKKVIFDFHEDVFEQIKAKSYINKFFRMPIAYFYNFLEKKMVRKFDGIIVATDHIAKKYQDLNSNIEVIYNYPLLEEFNEMELNEKKPKNLIYIGGLSKARGTFDLIEFARKRKDYNFIVCGNFYNQHDKAYFLENAPPNLIYKGYLSRKEIGEELNLARLGIVLLEPLERYKVSLPIKMFEYMAAYVPVLANNFDLWNDIVLENNTGFTVNKDDHESILDKIDQVMNDDKLAIKMGENGRNLVFNKCNWLEEEAKLISFYKKLEAK